MSRNKLTEQLESLAREILSSENHVNISSNEKELSGYIVKLSFVRICFMNMDPNNPSNIESPKSGPAYAIYLSEGFNENNFDQHKEVIAHNIQKILDEAKNIDRLTPVGICQKGKRYMIKTDGTYDDITN